jgi:hypothetical protein
LLKDVYKFYKNSPKRKLGLEATALRREKVLAQFVATMTTEVETGKDDLKKIPSLRLKKWNATRWLGRTVCLTALCNAYEYILDHLSEFSETRAESAKDRKTAADLYRDLTTYDNFLFLFFYRELASMMARTSQLLQAKDIQIRDVGRRIMTLCGRLYADYDSESLIPKDLTGDGEADNIMRELFGEDLDRKSQNKIED